MVTATAGMRMTERSGVRMESGAPVKAILPNKVRVHMKAAHVKASRYHQGEMRQRTMGRSRANTPESPLPMRTTVPNVDPSRRNLPK